ncbi:hypothetical protein M438DRAFT_346523 [Aureobasidium pullulans EXF-150]|uniref:Uncharacterized protein n=1 Tax=Aureobasidium pullulans EXF-150 TaxID=1043002 RepID=A0A074XNL3_AURPU|nr:uncharacterized protein M438DRAFT_346523 [Aureobasidium pullulans EXF-150]KEQ83587.1 hypothetical protein M438DRAFT_346523 [Aureobasidium pullulans EXF-150]
MVYVAWTATLPGIGLSLMASICAMHARCMQGRTTMSFAPQDATNVPHAKRICLAPTISVELQQPNDGRGRQSRTAMSATPVRSGSREKGFGQTERPARM